MSPAPRRKRTRADVVAERVRAGQRHASRRPCPTCGADTLVGEDADRGSLTVTVDVEAVGPVAELQAFAEGRGVYLARRNGGDVELDRRDTWQVRATPAGLTPHPVLIEHRCEEHPPPTPVVGLFDLPAGHDVGTPRSARRRAPTERPNA